MNKITLLIAAIMFTGCEPKVVEKVVTQEVIKEVIVEQCATKGCEAQLSKIKTELANTLKMLKAANLELNKTVKKYQKLDKNNTACLNDKEILTKSLYEVQNNIEELLAEEELFVNFFNESLVSLSHCKSTLATCTEYYMECVDVFEKIND